MSEWFTEVRLELTSCSSSTLQGRIRQSRRCCCDWHCSLSLVTLIDTPIPQDTEQALHAVLSLMQRSVCATTPELEHIIPLINNTGVYCKTESAQY